MAEIRALGHLPGFGRGSGAHYNMAKRLRYAKLKGLLNETQLAELAQLEAPPGSKSRKVWSAGRVDALMTEIRALGRIPRRTGGHEDALYNRLYYVKANNLLSDSQLAELAELVASDSRAASDSAAGRPPP